MSEHTPLPSQEFEPLPPEEAGELEALATTSFLHSLQQFFSAVPERVVYKLQYEKAEIAAGVLFGAFQFFAALDRLADKPVAQGVKFFNAASWGFLGLVAGDLLVRGVRDHFRGSRRE